MNQELNQQKITEAMTKLEEAIAILKQVTQGIETTVREIYEITKYNSGSGNTTWKADCDDGNRVYFRQAHKPMYQDIGVWEWLNELDWEVVTPVKIEIETIPDGDFLKIVAVNSWKEIDDTE